MTKIFSVASWNVEHFANNKNRIRENIEFVQQSNPDVFAIFEVEGKQVFSDFVSLMPTHNFFITEDLSKMETLIGVNRNFTAFVTQRQAIKSKIPTLRPGALVTLALDNQFYSILFVHLKSLPDPRSWGLRDDMISHILNLKKALDKASGKPEGANFICMGDFNTMGLNVTYAKNDMSGAEELARYSRRFKGRKMRLLPKTAPATWWGGQDTTIPPSNLDHVFASQSLQFQKFAQDAEVAVRGWPELADEITQTDWINNHSDHGLLYSEVIEP